MFNREDKEQIIARGMTVETAEAQVALFKKGIPFVRLVRPCTAEDGVAVLNENECDRLETLYTEALRDRTPIKFTPASGAATRMFKTLHTVNNRYPEEEQAPPAKIEAIEDRELAQVHRFLNQLRSFAFFEALARATARAGFDLDRLVAAGRFKTVLHYLLDPEGLDYANLPKALLQFHRYGDRSRTAMEEHLVEAAAYTQDHRGTARAHFTISPGHESGFRTHLDDIRPLYETGGITIAIDMSFQSPSTDTIAVHPDNSPFRDETGRLLFRPGGHGALLKNLDELDADIVFIKNIDNVVPDRLKPTTVRFKQVLGGLLIETERRLFRILDRLADGSVRDGDIDEARAFAGEAFHIATEEQTARLSKNERRGRLYALLNRPLRVCGMVRNVGEPGGGPFWVQNPDGSVSRQIIESSQIDMKDQRQESIWRSSTHFNPVDLVCGVRDHQGRPFDLLQYADPDTGFISMKSRNGRDLKAMELPGLWNGAMARWNTLFVEVPEITFNPVKTVFDLLRPNHLEG